MLGLLRVHDQAPSPTDSASATHHKTSRIHSLPGATHPTYDYSTRYRHEMQPDIRPFSIAIPDNDLSDLYKRLELTRLPDELDLPAGQEWEWGMPLAVLKPVIDYWRTQYDWRAVEERINRTLPQFTTRVESLAHGPLEIHFVHKRSDNPSAIPLLFIHGWPGNFLEV